MLQKHKYSHQNAKRATPTRRGGVWILTQLKACESSSGLLPPTTAASGGAAAISLLIKASSASICPPLIGITCSGLEFLRGSLFHGNYVAPELTADK